MNISSGGTIPYIRGQNVYMSFVFLRELYCDSFWFFTPTKESNLRIINSFICFEFAATYLKL